MTSMIFTHYDRTQMCNHQGMLGRKLDDGTRVCARCGSTVHPDKTDNFTAPVGPAEVNRRSVARRVR